MTRVPIVAAFRATIRRVLGGKFDAPDAFDLLDAVFRRCHKPERRAVFHRQRRAIHLVGEQSLRMLGISKPT